MQSNKINVLPVEAKDNVVNTKHTHTSSNISDK